MFKTTPNMIILLILTAHRKGEVRDSTSITCSF